MKLSFSTNAFTRCSVFDAVERIASAGYAGVELLADAPHLYAPTVTARDLEKLKEILDRTGLKVANVNANTAMGYYGRQFWEPIFEPSLANPDPVERRWRIDYSRKCIDMAGILGAPNVSVTSGRMVSGVAPEESLDLLRESLGELLPYAESQGIRIGVEYEPGLLVERCEELTALIEEMRSPTLGANLDFGHSIVLGEKIREVTERLSGRIFHTHIEDIRNGKHYHLIPGLGDVDFKAIFNALRAHSYDGFVTVELYTYPHMPEEAAKRSFEYLQSLLSDSRGENS
jgi:fructoselysine 3-epimerase